MNDFHKSKQSAAVLKHAVIDSYATPFGSKTGSVSKDNRVAFLDGYAGPGRYEDGSEGSGAMLLRKANELGKMATPRNVECHFVEEAPEVVARLREVAAAEAGAVSYTITDGKISEHLPTLLESVKDIPLFVYLDPCGLIIPMDEVATIFERPGGVGHPPTEVLINLTAHLRRFAGILTSPNPIEASLARMDAVCGGDWWRDTWLKHLPDTDAAELAVVQGYAAKLSERAGGAGTWIIDVRPRADLKPIYYLVFATRSLHGMIAFGEAASIGLERWRAFHAEAAAEDDLFGTAADWEVEWKAAEKRMADGWVDTLAARMAAELAKGRPFTVFDRADEILGTDLAGVVRTKHLRAAINKLFAEGKTSTNPKGVKDLYSLTITPA